MVVKLPPGLPPSFSVCRDVRSKRQISPPPQQKVACSYSHTVIVTSDDQTWTFGGNHYGQLGHGDKNHRSVPAAVPCFQGVGVVSVACGVYHTVGGGGGG